MVQRVFLTTDLIGGVWQYSLDLSRAYIRQGLHVDLAVLGPAAPYSTRLQEASHLPGLAVIETGLPLDWTARGEAELAAASVELAKLARQRCADIVHLNSAGLGCVGGWSAPLVITLHSCVTTWWRAVKPDMALLPDFVWRTERVAEALRNADAIVAPTRSFAAMAADVYGRDLPWKPIHNGREPYPVVDYVAQEKSVLSCGRLWDEGKNMAALDAAAALLDWPVKVAGSVRHPDGADVAFKNLELLGEQSSDDFRAELGRAGVFVSTALYEPFGLGALEAGQAGCALVLSDIPTFREIWGEAASFVAPRDQAAIAGAVERLLSSPGERKLWGERARDRAAAYSSEDMARKTLSLYRRLCAQRQIAGAA